MLGISISLSGFCPVLPVCTVYIRIEYIRMYHMYGGEAVMLLKGLLNVLCIPEKSSVCWYVDVIETCVMVCVHQNLRLKTQLKIQSQSAERNEWKSLCTFTVQNVHTRCLESFGCVALNNNGYFLSRLYKWTILGFYL